MLTRQGNLSHGPTTTNEMGEGSIRAYVREVPPNRLAKEMTFNRKYRDLPYPLFNLSTRKDSPTRSPIAGKGPNL